MERRVEEEEILFQLNLRKAYLRVFGTIYAHLQWN